MKKQITSALLSFAMLFVLTATASAQTARRITIQIPFDFVAGRAHMPAGRYNVRRARDDSESALILQSEDGRASVIVITSAGDGVPERAQAIFRQHGSQFFLAAVSMPGTSSVRELPKTGAEKKLERELREAAKTDDAGAKSVTVVGRVQ